MLERTQANHEETNIHFSRPYTAISVVLLDESQSNEFGVISFTNEVYEFVRCTNSSVG